MIVANITIALVANGTETSTTNVTKTLSLTLQTFLL